jgi:hypothetical protein
VEEVRLGSSGHGPSILRMNTWTHARVVWEFCRLRHYPFSRSLTHVPTNIYETKLNHNIDQGGKSQNHRFRIGPLSKNARGFG